MKLIPLIATSEKVDIKKNIVVYETEVVSSSPGLIVTDDRGEFDMKICNTVHRGGGDAITVIAKPTATPSRKFKVGDQVGVLVVQE
jgi:hypothetical protein